MSFSWEPYGLTEPPDGPQANALNILRLQKVRAQIRVSERSQGLTFTKDMGRSSLRPSALPTQWTVNQPYYVYVSSQGVVSGE